MADLTINLGLTAIATGAADVITATYAPAPTLVDRKVLFLRAIATNATTTPTFNPNALGAQTITKNGGQPLEAGDISGAGFVAILMYDLANTNWELINPSSGKNIGNSDLTLTGNRTLNGDGNDLAFTDMPNFSVTADLLISLSVNDGAGKSAAFEQDVSAPSNTMQATDVAVGEGEVSAGSTIAFMRYVNAAGTKDGAVECDANGTTIRHTDKLFMETPGQIAGTILNNSVLTMVDENTGEAEFIGITFEWDSHQTGDVVAAGITSFLCAKPGPSGDSATLNLRQGFVSHDCRARTARIQTRTTQSAGGALTFTLQLNGVDTAMVISIPASTGAGVFSASFDVDFAVGDLVNWKVNNAGSGNSAALCAGNISGTLI